MTLGVRRRGTGPPKWVQSAMNIWNKVLLGLIVVTLIPLFYFSLQALKTHRHWRTAAKKIEAQLPILTERIDTLRYGDPNQDDGECLQSVRMELYKYFVNRGRIWKKCVFQGVKGNEVLVSVGKPSPHQIAENMVLFVFDEASIRDGGCFLGEFRVNSLNPPNQVVLTPTMGLSPRARKRIQGGKGLWTLCEVMPKDTHKVFAGMSKKELRSRMPAQVVDEYLAHGKDGKQRQLRDYYVLLKESDHQEAVLLEEKRSAKRNKQYMEAAVKDAKQQELFRQTERASLMEKLEKVKRERKAALAYQQSLEKELAQLEAKIAQLMKDNRAVAAEIAKMQSEMIRRVDRRTAVVAQ